MSKLLSLACSFFSGLAIMTGVVTVSLACTQIASADDPYGDPYSAVKCTNGAGGATTCVSDGVGCTLPTKGKNCDAAKIQCTCKSRANNPCVCAP
jgi:hypothetical protein